MPDAEPTWIGLANHWGSAHPPALALFFGYPDECGAEIVAMVERALRFAAAHGLTYPRDLPKHEQK